MEMLKEDPILGPLTEESSSKVKEYDPNKPKTMVDFLQEEVDWLFEGTYIFCY